MSMRLCRCFNFMLVRQFVQRVLFVVCGLVFYVGFCSG